MRLSNSGDCRAKSISPFEVRFGTVKPGIHIVVMVVSTVANMFLTLFPVVLIHVNIFIPTSQASLAL